MVLNQKDPIHKLTFPAIWNYSKFVSSKQMMSEEVGGIS